MAVNNNRLLRKEVESLNARLKKFNQENDDLLQRLSDLKFQKEQKEEEFEQEKLILRSRIRGLEAEKLEIGHQLNSVKRKLDEKVPTGEHHASREDELSRRQAEGRKQEHARREWELLERLKSLRLENETKERGWKREVEKLQSTVQSKQKTIDEMRLEKNRLMARPRTLEEEEEERRLRQEVADMRRVMEAEARDLKDARRENGELRKGLDGRTEGMRRRLDESNEALRLKERELDEAKREIARLANSRSSDLSSKEREAALRREVDRLTTLVDVKQNLLEEATKDQARLRRIADLQLNDGGSGEAKLEHEVDRLRATLTSKESQLKETTDDRLRLQKEIDRLVSVRGLVSEREGQSLRNEVDRLTVCVRSKEVLLEDSLTKNVELTAANEQLEKNLRETRSLLKTTSDTNQELVDRNLKLERAVAKTTKADSVHASDEKVSSNLRSLLKEREVSPNLRSLLKEQEVSPNLRSLLKEQESHIEDLQRQVGTIRTAIMDNAKTRQMAILAALPEIEADDEDKDQGDGGILQELKQAKSNLDFSQRRISQLESWLDEIYTTTGVIGGGGGGGSGSGGGGVGSVRRPMARQRRSGNRSVLAASKRTARGGFTLPELTDLDEYAMERTYSTMRSNRLTNFNRRTQPSWNATTSTS